MNTLTPRRNLPRAFSLIELMVVIAIIAILAGLIAGLLPGVKQKQVRARISTDMNVLDGAIKRYKERIGFYPPDNPNPALTDRTLLYYELTATEPEAVVTNFMGVTGIANSGEQRRNFCEGLKHTALAVVPGSPNATNLLVAYKGTNGSINDLNFWHYNSSNPQHNIDGFDLWAVIVLNGQQVIIGNWKD